MLKSEQTFTRQKWLAIVFVLLFAAIGGYLLLHSHAELTTFVSQEAEVGVNSPATVVNDPSASGGKALQFNAQAAAGAFLSYPHQTATQSFSGSNVEVSNRSYVSLSNSKAVLTISNANNVYLHDLDFDGNCGDIFLINVTGKIRIENIRARNTGGSSDVCPIGSGHKNVIQLNNSWQGAPASDTTAGIRNVKSYGGQTEDVLSFFRSGGLDEAHPLVIENNHLESPLPGSADGAMAWQSGSGTCINTADGDHDAGDAGHDMIVRNNTLLNCGIVGLQMNRPLRVTDTGNIVYGAARPSPNTNGVGLSQWSSNPCSACVGNSYNHNRVWWVKPSGTAAPVWISNTISFLTDPDNTPVNSFNVLQDTTINPDSLKVVL